MRVSPLFPALLLASACGSNEFQPPPPPAVTVATPTQRDVVEYTEFTGTTQAHRIVEVPARVQGILQEIYYAEGARVERGAPLFRIDPAPFVAARDAAKARVTSAEAQAKLSDTTAQRMERSARDNAVSEIQALESRAQADAAAAGVEVAEKELAISQLDVDYTEVLAPISGLVEASNYKVGALVGFFGGLPLTTVHDDTSIYAWFTIPDSAVLEYRREHGADTGDLPEVELATEIDEGFPHKGRVDYVDPSVDSETGTLRARAVFENPSPTLFGGLFVRCRIAMRTLEGALLVPEAAIGADQVGRYVYVVDDTGTVARRDVSLGPREGKARVVTSGIEAEDRIIVEGLLRARPGAKVTPRTADDG